MRSLCMRDLGMRFRLTCPNATDFLSKKTLLRWAAIDVETAELKQPNVKLSAAVSHSAVSKAWISSCRTLATVSSCPASTSIIEGIIDVAERLHKCGAAVGRDGVKIRIVISGVDVEARSREDLASRLLAGLVFVFALFIVSSMAVIQRRAYSALPWADMWDYWIWYLKPHPSLLIKLFALHNEHRIVVARLFFLADHLLFQGRAIFIFISIFVIQFFHAILLWRLAYLAHPRRNALSVFMGSTAFVCLFSAEQYANFTWSFQIPFVAVYFAVTGALASLMVFARLSAEEQPASERRRWLWLGITILVGIVATYSMANGLLVWPILLLEAFWFGLPRRTKLILLVASVAMWALYLWSYKTPLQTSSIREGFHHLPQSFVFAMCVLGSPLNAIVSEVNRIFAIGSENWQLVWTAIAGLVGFIAAAFLTIAFLRNRREANRADEVILHLLVFLVATSFLIGLGRANFPLRNALQSRYGTPALLFWFCILFLFSSLIARTSRAHHSQSLLLFQFAGAMIVLLVVVLYQPTQIRYARDVALYVSESEAAISAPAYDQEVWGRNYYNPRAMIPAVQYLQSKHLSIFALERTRWLGEPITAHYHPVAPDNCTGYFDDVQAEPDPELPGLRLRGWAWNPQSRRIARSVVLTDKQGRILDFGYTGFDRPDVQAAQPAIGRAVGWTGFIPGLSHDFIAAYMVTGDGSSVCLVGTVQPVLR